MEATIEIINTRPERRRVWIEPWCSEHFLAAGQRLGIVIEHPSEPTFDLREDENETVIWLNQHTAAYILDHGVRRHILDCWCDTPASPTGVQENQPLLWTDPRRGGTFL